MFQENNEEQQQQHPIADNSDQLIQAAVLRANLFNSIKNEGQQFHSQGYQSKLSLIAWKS